MTIPNADEVVLREAFVQHLRRIKSRLPEGIAEVERDAVVSGTRVDALVTYPPVPPHVPIAVALSCAGWLSERSDDALVALASLREEQGVTLRVWAPPPGASAEERHAALSLDIDILEFNLLDELIPYEPVCWFVDQEFPHPSALTHFDEWRQGRRSVLSTTHVDAVDVARATVDILLASCGATP